MRILSHSEYELALNRATQQAERLETLVHRINRYRAKNHSVTDDPALREAYQEMADALEDLEHSMEGV